MLISLTFIITGPKLLRGLQCGHDISDPNFLSYLGMFIYIYLNDIIIFSDSIEDHVKHVRVMFDILRKEKLYLGPSKMQLFADELRILGHIIDD
jgi:hypothetical protein